MYVCMYAVCMYVCVSTTVVFFWQILAVLENLFQVLYMPRDIAQTIAGCSELGSREGPVCTVLLDNLENAPNP